MGEELEEVVKLKYLGVRINVDGCRREEVVDRVPEGRKIRGSLGKMWKEKTSREIKIKVNEIFGGRWQFPKRYTRNVCRINWAKYIGMRTKVT